MKKKCAFLALAFLIIFMTVGTASGQTGAEDVGGGLPVAVTVKDETVYINLNADGSIKEINVVNRLETPAKGVYTDYGKYEEIISLTNGMQPSVRGDAIRWSLEAGEDGFYYQGRMGEGEPPFLIDVQYHLNGNAVSGEDMAGKEGRARITLTVTPNPNAHDSYKDHYVCQIQTSLELDKAQNVKAQTANSVIVGRKQMLSYTLLPGKSAVYEIAFDTGSFVFGGFEMTAIPFDTAGMLDMDIDELQDGINELQDGTQELIDGTGDLKDGLSKLSRGVSKLSSGAKEAKSGLAELQTGAEGLTGGVSEFTANAQDIRDALKALKANAADIKSGFGEIKDNVSAVFGELSPYATPELSGQMAYLEAQMDAYGEGLDDFYGAVGGIADGMEAFCTGLKALDDAGGALTPGLASIVEGMGQLADGLSKMASQMKKLPDAVQELIDGQTELKDGVSEATDSFDGLNTGRLTEAVSFVSDKNKPRSVQFLWKTPELMEETPAEETAPQQQDETSLLDKIKALFW